MAEVLADNERIQCPTGLSGDDLATCVIPQADHAVHAVGGLVIQGRCIGIRSDFPPLAEQLSETP
jgi:hypothetical protein